MDAKEKQRVCVNFGIKLNKLFMETFLILQKAYGDDVMSRSWCHEWIKRFKEVRTSTQNDFQSQLAKVNALERSNRCLTIHEMAEECHISFAILSTPLCVQPKGIHWRRKIWSIIHFFDKALLKMSWNFLIIVCLFFNKYMERKKEILKIYRNNHGKKLNTWLSNVEK